MLTDQVFREKHDEISNGFKQIQMEHPAFKRIPLLLPWHLRVDLMLMLNIPLTLHLLYPHQRILRLRFFKVGGQFLIFFCGVEFFFSVKFFQCQIFSGQSFFFFFSGLGIGTYGTWCQDFKVGTFKG